MSLREIELQAQLDRRDEYIIQLEREALPYCYNGITLRKGDKLTLKDPKDDKRFYTSYLGGLFECGKVDTAYLEVKRRDWGEYYFVLTFSLDGELCTQGHIRDSENDEWVEFTEDTDYTFLRYFLKKGGRRDE